MVGAPGFPAVELLHPATASIATDIDSHPNATRIFMNVALFGVPVY
jgi:hypothetical protein